MRFMSISLVIAALSLTVGACGGEGGGGAGKSVTVSPGVQAAPVGLAESGSRSDARGGYLKKDDDGHQDEFDEIDDPPVRRYGRAASVADTVAVTALVRRYYRAAAAGDGAAACSLMLPRLAREPNLGEAAEKVYPLPVALPPLHGRSCAEIMSVLFREDHAHLVAESETLRAIHVRVNGKAGLAILGFSATPERTVTVRREHGSWSVDSVLDSQMP
jgi:hypothetical protein